MINKFAVSSVLLLLVACGGGSKSGKDKTLPPTPPTKLATTGLFTMPATHTTPITIKAKTNATSKLVWETSFTIQ